MGKSDRVVVIGAGFGGIQAALVLAKAGVPTTVVDRANHHLFQPLLYQVATAGLSPANIATPIRTVLRKYKNCDVVLGEVVDIDTAAQQVILNEGDKIPYSDLIIATGATHSYFGHEDWEKFAPGLKQVDDAVQVRRRILLAFEEAERLHDESPEWLTFLVVGAGPTGVELAGAIAELSTRVIRDEFRHIDPSKARIVLVEAGPRVLSAYPESLSEYARQRLETMGVEVLLNTKVEGIDNHGVDTDKGRLPSRTVVWAAGVKASPVAKWLKREPDRAGRVEVDDHCRVPGLDHLYLIGDAALFKDKDGQPLPGVSPVAMQQGRYCARRILSTRDNQPEVAPFKYWDKGTMATIGRRSAVAATGKLKLTGFIAWLAWLFVHIWYLIGFRNKLLVILQWAWAYVSWYRGARLITPVHETSSGHDKL